MHIHQPTGQRTGGGQGQKVLGGRHPHGGGPHQGADLKFLEESKRHVLVAKLAIICYTCSCYSYKFLNVINQFVTICISFL